MIKKTFKKILDFVLENKKLLVILLGTTLLFPLITHAGIIAEITAGFFKVILSIPFHISKWAAMLSIRLFDFVTDPGFTGLSYTNPAGNPIIKLGLEITRPFANLAIVFSLILAGLAIAVGYNEYGSKKTVLKLVVVALLVNFVPLALGAVIDAANIVTFYFFDNIGNAPTMLENVIAGEGVAGTEINNALNKEANFDSIEIYGLLTAIIFNGALAWTFFVYALIFFLRYIYIWTLVILSPLAFVAWVVPGTQGLFKKWWKQFIDWAFIGVPAGFFIYIGLNMLTQIADRFDTFNMGAPDFDLTAKIIRGILPSAVVLLFLWFGTKMARKMASSAASATVAAAGMAVSGGATAASSVGKGIGRWARNSSRTDTIATKGKELKTAKGKEGETLKENFHRYVTRPTGKKLEQAFSGKEAYFKAKKESKDKDPSDQEYALLQARGAATKAGHAAAIQAAGNEDKVNLTSEQLKTGPYEKAIAYNDKETVQKIEQSLSNILAKTERTKEEKGIFNKFKNVAQSQIPEEVRISKDDIMAIGDEIDDIASVNNIKLNEKEEEQASTEEERREMLANKIKNKRVLDGITKKEFKEKGYRNHIDKIVDNIKSEDDIKKISDAIDKKKTMEAYHRFANGEQISKSVKEIGQNFVDNFDKTKKSAEWYLSIDHTGKIKNRAAPFYLQSSSAGKLGLSPVENEEGEVMKKEDLNEYLRNSKRTKKTQSNKTNTSSKGSDSSGSKGESSHRPRSTRPTKKARPRGGMGSTKDKDNSGRERGGMGT